MNTAGFLVAVRRGCTQTSRRPLLALPVSSSMVRCCRQSTETVPAARMPYRVKVSAGKRYAWCACGHSDKQPYCDGAHRTSLLYASPLTKTGWSCCVPVRKPKMRHTVTARTLRSYSGI